MKLLHYTSAATIRQLLELLILRVMQKGESNKDVEITRKKGEIQKQIQVQKGQCKGRRE
jgi:hypothetical protein